MRDQVAEHTRAGGSAGNPALVHVATGSREIDRAPGDRRAARARARIRALHEASARILLLVLASACLVGCLTVRFTEGKPLPQDRIDQIRIGETTKGEILDWFGAPEGFSDASSLESLLSTYELQPEDVFDLPFADALVFRFTAGEVEARYLIVYLNAEVTLKTETLVVFFDEADRVRYFGYSGGIVPDEEDGEGEEG